MQPVTSFSQPGGQGSDGEDVVGGYDVGYVVGYVGCVVGYVVGYVESGGYVVEYVESGG